LRPLFWLRKRNLSAQLLLKRAERQAPEAKEKSFKRAEAGRAKFCRAGWTGGFMKSIGKVMLGTALAVGAMGLAAVPAHAAHIRVGVVVGGPVAYVPPCPGPGYVWVNSYWADGAWEPGYWNYAGVSPAVGFGVRIGGPVVHYDHGPVYRGYVGREHVYGFRR
jgi:hypothetical protein